MLLISLNELFRVIEVCEWRVISVSECFILDTACFAIRISNRSGLTNALFYFLLFYVLACCAIVWLLSFLFFSFFFFSCFLLFVFMVKSDWSAINCTIHNKRKHSTRAKRNQQQKTQKHNKRSLTPDTLVARDNSHQSHRRRVLLYEPQKNKSTAHVCVIVSTSYYD